MNKPELEKFQTVPLTLRWSVFALSVLVIAGCVTTSHDKGDSTARSLERAAAEVQGQSRALDLTMNSLNDLVNNPGADLKPQYATFSRSLDQLEASAKRNAAAQTNVSRNASAYFKAWETQLDSVNYEVIRNQGQARRAEVKKTFEEVNQQFHEAQSALMPLMDYLEDIRKSLGADLTVGGLQSVKGFLSNAQENAAKVQTALGKVSTQLASAETSFSSVLQTAKADGTNAPAATASPKSSEAKKQ